MLIDELRTRLSAFNDVFNHDMLTVQQRDYMWFKCRLGVITASSISGVLAKTGSAARDGIMAELIAEIATGSPGEPVSAKALQHGIDNEPFAIESYSFATGEIVNQIPFVYRDETMRCGCSPDGVTEKKTIECKAPWNTRYHIEAIVDGRIKKEYQEQVQFQMWVCGTESVDFVSFDPRMLKHNFFMTTVERSDLFMKKFDDAIPQFIMEMDAKLERLGFKFGEQFKA